MRKIFKMDANSIISFNNESTFQNTLKLDLNQNEALEIALRAMKDRCVLFQKRLSDLENENMKLKIEKNKLNVYELTETSASSTEQLLREEIASLMKQKSQLMHHVFMVTCENKQLWSNLSGCKRDLIATIMDKPMEEKKQSRLLRNRTFIHCSPEKRNLLDGKDTYVDTSLEEISLKLINSYLQEKSDLVEQYDQMVEMQTAEDGGLKFDSVGFTYYDSQDLDWLLDIKNEIDQLSKLKKDIMEQEANLKNIIHILESKLKEEVRCKICEHHSKIGKSELNKDHEESQTESMTKWATPQISNSYSNNTNDDPLKLPNKLKGVSNNRKDNNDSNYCNESLEDNDNPKARMCPICGEYFKKSVDFTEFTSHVESHFKGDEDDDDFLIDNYDIVVGSRGNEFDLI